MPVCSGCLKFGHECIYDRIPAGLQPQRSRLVQSRRFNIGPVLMRFSLFRNPSANNVPNAGTRPTYALDALPLQGPGHNAPHTLQPPFAANSTPSQRHDIFRNQGINMPTVQPQPAVNHAGWYHYQAPGFSSNQPAVHGSLHQGSSPAFFLPDHVLPPQNYMTSRHGRESNQQQLSHLSLYSGPTGKLRT